MSGGKRCKCPEKKKPMDQRNWTLIEYKCNYSAFSGYRRTPSNYSCVRCNVCGALWRTTDNDVIEIKDHAKRS